MGAVYLDDIVKELSEEFGIKETEMLEICKKSLIHASNLTKDPKVISIRFPNLGILHFNAIKARASKTNAIYAKDKDTIEQQIKLVEKLKKFNKDIVHARRCYFGGIKKYFFKDIKTRALVGRQEVYKKMEVKQNKIK
jgi:hypothetical protein